MIVATHQYARVTGEHDEWDVASLECRLQLFAVLIGEGLVEQGHVDRLLADNVERLRHRAERPDDFGAGSRKTIAVVECLERLVLDDHHLAAVQPRGASRCGHSEHSA